VKEIKIVEWIYKSKSDKEKVVVRIPKGTKLPKGNYLIKIYLLESET